jgi:hypothetical protein
MFGRNDVLAQTANYTYKVKYRTNDNKELETSGLYGHYYEYSEAQRVYDKMVSGIRDDHKSASDFLSEFALESSSAGVFTFAGANGMGVVFATNENEVFIIMHADGNWKNKKGKTSQGNDITYSCKKIDGGYEYEVFIGSAQKLGNVNIDSKLRSTGGNRRKSFDYEDGYEHWEYHLEFPVGQHEKDSRIIILPYAVDCLTEDTVAHLPAAVYEGKDYHALQNKRKGFDYESLDPIGKERLEVVHIVTRDTIHREKRKVIRPKYDKNGRTIEDGKGGFLMDTIYVDNDSIIVNTRIEKRKRPGYICAIEDLVHKDGKIVVDTIIDFKRPIKDHKYRGFLKLYVEDYHHKTYEGVDPGTCLRISPYKFLQMGTAAVDLMLTDEFYENSQERPSEDEKDLAIQFTYNTADIIEDSMYYESISALENTIANVRATGGHILGATLEAYASPDGNEKHNMELADKRARAARGRIHIGNVSIETKPMIDSWEHTAELLDEKMHPAEAQLVREALAQSKNKDAAEQVIKKIPSYSEVIKPILESQCRISFKYSFFTKKKLNAQEAVVAYRKNKRDPSFSNGDYYNMFSELKDSAEIDTLTEIVYKRIVKQLKQYDRPLATYVINKMALLGIKRGAPDSTVLMPLIYERNNQIRLNYLKTDADGILQPIKMNRPEIILNQAVIFYQLQEHERAKWYVDMLVENGYSSPALVKLQNYINFRRLYRIPENQRTPLERAAFNVALEYVENSGPDNKAVLYTEFDELNKSELAWQYVLQMRDDNPVKWYLMALLWAKRDGKEGNYPLPDVGEIDANDIKGVDMSWNVVGYPYYLAYFEKCFETDKNFMKHYFNEGRISEDMRKKRRHAYKNSRIPIYKKIYALRSFADKQEHAKYLEMKSSDKEENKEQNVPTQDSKQEETVKETADNNVNNPANDARE